MLEVQEPQQPMGEKTSQGSPFLRVLPFLVLAVLYLVFLNPYPDLQGFNAHDPFHYISRAISLWQGDGYGERFADGFLPVTLQPPAFSTLLAPLVGLFGADFRVLKLLMVCLAGLLGLVSSGFYGQFLESDRSARWATLLLMSSPLIFGLSHQVMAEIPLMVLTLLGLIVLNDYLEESKPVWSRGLLLTVVLIVAASLFKSTAIGILAGGWLLFLHPRYRSRRCFKKLVVCTVLVAAGLAFWQIRNASTPQMWFWGRPFSDFFLLKNPYDPDSPVASAMDWYLRFRHNISGGLLPNIAESFVAPLFFLRDTHQAFLGRLGLLMGIPITLLLLWSWYRSLRSCPSVLEGFCLFSIVLLMAAHDGSAARYLAPVVPVLLVYGFRVLELHAPGDLRAQGNLRTYLPPVLVLTAFLTTAWYGWTQYQDPYGSRVSADYVDIACKAKETFQMETWCIAAYPTHWKVLTGHLPAFSEEELESFTSAVRPERYVVSLSADYRPGPGWMNKFARDLVERSTYVREGLERLKPPLEVVAENGTFVLYRLVSPTPALPPTGEGAPPLR